MYHPSPGIDDYEDIEDQIKAGFCFNTHCTTPEPATLTHWWTIEHDYTSYSFHACCENCARANTRTVDGLPIRRKGLLRELPSLGVWRAASPSHSPQSSPLPSRPPSPTPSIAPEVTIKPSSYLT